MCRTFSRQLAPLGQRDGQALIFTVISRVEAGTEVPGKPILPGMTAEGEVRIAASSGRCGFITCWPEHAVLVPNEIRPGVL